MHQKSLDNYLNLPELQNTHFEVLLMTIKDTPALHKKIYVNQAMVKFIY